MENPRDGNSKPSGSVGDVFESVVWPAVAGNVLWSFLTVLFTQQPDPVWAVRSVSLAVVGVYLIGSWRRTRKRGPATSWKYFLVDGTYAGLLSVFAITTAMAEISAGMKHPVIASIALLGMFATAALGHAKGFWAPYEGVDAGGEDGEENCAACSAFSLLQVWWSAISFTQSA